MGYNSNHESLFLFSKISIVSINHADYTVPYFSPLIVYICNGAYIRIRCTKSKKEKESNEAGEGSEEIDFHLALGTTITRDPSVLHKRKDRRRLEITEPPWIARQMKSPLLSDRGNCPFRRLVGGNSDLDARVPIDHRSNRLSQALRASFSLRFLVPPF